QCGQRNEESSNGKRSEAHRRAVAGTSQPSQQCRAIQTASRSELYPLHFSASFSLRDVIRSCTTPFVTLLFIVLNVLAFLYEVSLPESALARLVRIYGLVPAALAGPRVITSMFRTAGSSHFCCHPCRQLHGRGGALWFSNGNPDSHSAILGTRPHGEHCVLPV